MNTSYPESDLRNYIQPGEVFDPRTKYLVTLKLQQRIKLRKKDLHLSLQNIAERSEKLTVNIIKNILRRDTSENEFKKKGGNQFITFSQLVDLSQALECSTDYLLGASDDINKDVYGNEIIVQPLSFSYKTRFLNFVIDELRNDQNTLTSLYFLYKEIPSTQRKQLIDGFNAYIKMLSEWSYISITNRIDKEKLSIINHIINMNDSQQVDALQQLIDANTHYANREYKKAIRLYFKIILYACEKDPYFGKLAGSAVDALIQISMTKACKFELDETIEGDLRVLKKSRFYVDESLRNEYISKIKKFLKEQGIEIDIPIE